MDVIASCIAAFFPDASFDYILDGGSFSSLDLSKALPELARALKPGGTLVVSDVSRTHPYMRLGLKHPFHRQIEWHKHQHPRVWASLLESVGFSAVTYHWATQWRYPQLPRFLTDNSFAVQLYSSQFVLHARK